MNPSRGEIWLIDLNPVRGREQAGQRPCLIISVDLFNHGPAELIVILPITSKIKNIPFHVTLKPPEGHINVESFIKCEDIRSASRNRLVKKIGLEISAIEDKKEDKRLDTLRQELEEILHKIVEMQSSILVSD